MPEVIRFGVSIESPLLERFDELSARKGYGNRSEAIRDLMRSALVDEQWDVGEAETVGTVTLVYDHHASDLADKLNQQQHSHHEAIVSTLHVHMDAHHCLEVVVLKGKANQIKRLADELIGTKGVKHGKFVASTTGGLV